MDYTPVAEDTEMKGATVTWALFQPKWQANDYYENNFRLNKYDSATIYYKDGIESLVTTTLLASNDVFKSSGENEIVTGANYIGFSAAVAFAAAALTF